MKKWILPIIAIAAIAAVLLLWKRPAQGDAEPAPAAAAVSTGIVQFRMEQQWLIHMKLAKTQEAELPSQIYSTGRVIPSPSNRALVAPPGPAHPRAAFPLPSTATPLGLLNWPLPLP